MSRLISLVKHVLLTVFVAGGRREPRSAHGDQMFRVLGTGLLVHPTRAATLFPNNKRNLHFLPVCFLCITLSVLRHIPILFFAAVFLVCEKLQLELCRQSHSLAWTTLSSWTFQIQRLLKTTNSKKGLSSNVHISCDL